MSNSDSGAARSRERIAAAACAEAGGVAPVSLVSGYLAALERAVADDRRLAADELAGCRAAGDAAAAQGLPLAAVVDAYLSATRMLWVGRPETGSPSAGPSAQELLARGRTMFRAVDDALAAVADGHAEAGRALIRQDESRRREFIDDMLSGQGDVAVLLHRAGRFGLSAGGPHLVLVAEGPAPVRDFDLAVARFTGELRAAWPGSTALVATKEGRLVAVLPRPSAATAGPRTSDAPAIERLGRALADGAGEGWRAAVSGPRAGLAEVAASYREAREALGVAKRLGWPQSVVHADQLLVYRVLLRDREAITGLVRRVLSPLAGARDGAGPLLDTLLAYFACGATATATARQLHLSVRAVTYRLSRIKDLTGYDPGDPDDWLPLHVAAAGARLLGWPSER